MGFFADRCEITVVSYFWPVKCLHRRLLQPLYVLFCCLSISSSKHLILFRNIGMLNAGFAEWSEITFRIRNVLGDAVMQ
jgi:hypothetical protein